MARMENIYAPMPIIRGTITCWRYLNVQVDIILVAVIVLAAEYKVMCTVLGFKSVIFDILVLTEKGA